MTGALVRKGGDNASDRGIFRPSSGRLDRNRQEEEKMGVGERERRGCKAHRLKELGALSLGPEGRGRRSPACLALLWHAFPPYC
jgi:hypothetical protein